MDRTSLLKSYARSMIHAASIINKQNPDYLVVPMMGSVPFIDAMSILDNDFDPSKAVYLPASSRINNVKKIITKWYKNFLDDVTDKGEFFPKIIGIDEVVSGGSVSRCFNALDNSTNSFRKCFKQNLMCKLHSEDKTISLNALNEIDKFLDNNYSSDIAIIRERRISDEYKVNKDLSREDSRFVSNLIKKNLENKLVYRTVGIEDSFGDGARNKEYKSLVENKRVFPVKTEKIITMDNPLFCPPRYKFSKTPSKKGYTIFTPEIHDFKITPEYVNFLEALARYVGKDPSKVSPVNFSLILDSNKYL